MVSGVVADMQNSGEAIPILKLIAAVSVGIVNGEAVLDLDYDEDSNCAPI